MRARLVFIAIAIVLIGAIAVQNWPEFNRASPLSIGPLDMTLPLGLLMLTIVGLVLAAFLVSSATLESRHLLEHRRHARALHAQRELAEKAEASRYTDLRTHLDNHLRETRQRDAIVASEFEKTVVQSQRDLRLQIEQLQHLMATRLADIDTRLGGRVVQPAGPVVTDVPVRDRVKL